MLPKLMQERDIPSANESGDLRGVFPNLLASISSGDDRVRVGRLKHVQTA